MELATESFDFRVTAEEGRLGARRFPFGDATGDRLLHRDLGRFERLPRSGEGHHLRDADATTLVDQLHLLRAPHPHLLGRALGLEAFRKALDLGEVEAQTALPQTCARRRHREPGIAQTDRLDHRAPETSQVAAPSGPRSFADPGAHPADRFGDARLLHRLIGFPRGENHDERLGGKTRLGRRIGRRGGQSRDPSDHRHGENLSTEALDGGSGVLRVLSGGPTEHLDPPKQRARPHSAGRRPPRQFFRRLRQTRLELRAGHRALGGPVGGEFIDPLDCQPRGLQIARLLHLLESGEGAGAKEIGERAFALGDAGVFRVTLAGEANLPPRLSLIPADQFGVRGMEVVLRTTSIGVQLSAALEPGRPFRFDRRETLALDREDRRRFGEARLQNVERSRFDRAIDFGGEIGEQFAPDRIEHFVTFDRLPESARRLGEVGETHRCGETPRLPPVACGTSARQCFERRIALVETGEGRGEASHRFGVFRDDDESVLERAIRRVEIPLGERSLTLTQIRREVASLELRESEEGRFRRSRLGGEQSTCLGHLPRRPHLVRTLHHRRGTTRGEKKTTEDEPADSPRRRAGPEHQTSSPLTSAGGRSTSGEGARTPREPR